MATFLPPRLLPSPSSSRLSQNHEASAQATVATMSPVTAPHTSRRATTSKSLGQTLKTNTALFANQSSKQRQRSLTRKIRSRPWSDTSASDHGSARDRSRQSSPGKVSSGATQNSASPLATPKASHSPTHFQRHWDFASTKDPAVLPRVPGVASPRMVGEYRSLHITVHGCLSELDAEWLVEKILAIDGVHQVFVQEFTRGGLRGGAVGLQLEVGPTVRIPALLDEVHLVEDRLLALPYKMDSWTWKGYKISYAVAGRGTPIILVHGFGGSAGHFRNLIAHLAHDHKVFAVDLLGFGNSDKPPDVAYGPDLWADIINDFAQEFSEEPPVLIGNSIGSLTALAAAGKLKQTEKAVRGLVLLNVAGGMNRKGLMEDEWVLRALSPIFIALEFLLQRPAFASLLFQRFRNKVNIRKILAEQVHATNPSVVDDRLVDILCEPAFEAGAQNVFVRVFTGEPGPRPEQLVKELGSVPMLVLWGDSDPWTPIRGKVAQLFRKLEAERSDVEVIPLPQVGHCPHDDQPELVAAHILPWINSLDSADL